MTTMTDKPIKEITNNNLPSALLQAKITSQFITIPQTTINYEDLYELFSKLEETKYLLVKLEHHEDGGLHIHMVIILKKQQRISFIHNKIMELEGEIGGLVDYRKIDKLVASINYLKKEETSVEGKPYKEYGDVGKLHGSNRFQQKDTEYVEQVLEAIRKAEEGDVEGAMEDIKQTDPKMYLQYKQQIKANLETENKQVKKYDLPDFTLGNVKLSKKQQEVWDVLQSTPKARRIIWVSGSYGSGKSFLYNYIKTNHEFRMYDAGQSASLDNVVYGYDEEGVIAWDLPRTFNFTEMGDVIASVIEKFSDFGQSITSKKYSGKTQKVRGHAIVFSNSPPIEQLSHRDVVYINLDEKEEKTTTNTLGKKIVKARRPVEEAHSPMLLDTRLHNVYQEEIPVQEAPAEEEQIDRKYSTHYNSKIRYNERTGFYDKLIIYNSGATRHVSYSTLQEAELDEPPVMY